MKKAEDEFKRLVYDLMNGYIELKENSADELTCVEDEFEEGKICHSAYTEILDAYQRICRRLGTVKEDRDLEIIMNNFNTIIECLSMKMYDYGRLFSRPSIRKP